MSAKFVKQAGLERTVSKKGFDLEELGNYQLAGVNRRHSEIV